LVNPRPGGRHTSALPGACFRRSGERGTGRRHTSACRAQPHLLPAGALLHLQPAGALLHLQPPGLCFTSSLPGLCFTSSLPGLCFTSSLPGLCFTSSLPGAVALTAPTASLSRSACQTGRYAQPSPPDARTPAKWHLLLGQNPPLTHGDPAEAQAAWTIPTVPCPSCQTASRRYAHSHRRAHIKQLLCQSGRVDFRILADGLGWRPPPRNPPAKPAALRYCPGETTEMANRHPSTHSATSPSVPACSPARWLKRFVKHRLAEAAMICARVVTT
jgi:hypothetical protein